MFCQDPTCKGTSVPSTEGLVCSDCREPIRPGKSKVIEKTPLTQENAVQFDPIKEPEESKIKCKVCGNTAEKDYNMVNVKMCPDCDEIYCYGNGIPREDFTGPFPDMKPPKDDPINQPTHYKINLKNGTDIEAIDIIKAKLTKEEFQGYCKGNILKYNLRAGNKGSYLEDLGKANKHLEFMEG